MTLDRQLDWRPRGAPPQWRGALGAFRCRQKKENVGGVWMKPPGYETDAQRIIQEWLPRYLDDPNQMIGLGWSGDDLVSVVNLDVTDPAEIYLRVIGVQADHRGCGLGHEAFGLAIELADEIARDASLSMYILLAKVHPANAGSQKVLTRGGMAPSGERDGALQYWSASVQL